MNKSYTVLFLKSLWNNDLDTIGPVDILKESLRAAAEAKARLQAKYPKAPRVGYLTFQARFEKKMLLLILFSFKFMFL